MTGRSEIDEGGKANESASKIRKEILNHYVKESNDLNIEEIPKLHETGK
jgi:hypothetical protein